VAPDEQLFDRINHSRQHILQQYLPDRPDLNYSLRNRNHNKTLICKTSELNDRDFIIRNLYKYCLLIVTAFLWHLLQLCF